MTFNSLSFDSNFTTESAGQVRALFWGLGADGTVSANKNSIKIIGEQTPNYAQGYFVYDSKKSGAMTVSHLRFGSEPIKSTYLIQRANFIAVHQFNFLERYQILEAAEDGATLLLNSPYEATEVWERLPRSVQEAIITKKIKVHSINAYAVAKANQLGNRTNTIMQTCFLAISGVLPRDAAQGPKGRHEIATTVRSWVAGLEMTRRSEDRHECVGPSGLNFLLGILTPT